MNIASCITGIFIAWIVPRVTKLRRLISCSKCPLRICGCENIYRKFDTAKCRFYRSLIHLAC